MCAVVAIWPLKSDVISPRLLKSRWINSDESDYALEIFMLEAKTKAWEYASQQTGSRMLALQIGFVMTALAFAATFVSAVVAALN